MIISLLFCQTKLALQLVSGRTFEKIPRGAKIFIKRQIDSFELFQNSLFVLSIFVNEPCVFGDNSELLCCEVKDSDLTMTCYVKVFPLPEG